VQGKGHRVGDDPFDECGDVADGDEVDGVLSAADDQRPVPSPGGLGEQVDPQLKKGGGPHDGRWHAAGGQRGLGGVFHPEQLHRAVRRSTYRRHEYDIGAGRAAASIKSLVPLADVVDGAFVLVGAGFGPPDSDLGQVRVEQP